MNKFLISNIARFVILVLLQVLILSNINFLGYINPYLYVFFILLLPLNLSQYKVIFFSFLIGLTIDTFEDSGGIHAAASVLIAYLRPSFLRFSFGISYEHQTVKFHQTPFAQRFSYISLLVFIHHLVLFSLEIFDVNFIVLLLKKTLFSSLFTILLILIVTGLFQQNKK
ncbi:rod shape-determining protein MreD [Mesonia ostreae]|uniref:Rod shape-determining protein MreD n=1 Tax=Mesonia ostreae TaxID=861110 RepID=A0ABU2KEJ4_9FLAO|nr:rod shape-determining protein MreD [Mesonia ostreae]MDT0293131.1 rod shape-determining protein MreD [Mesonia ostreae]